MLMAMESGELAASVVTDRLADIRQGTHLPELGDDYRTRYQQRFDSRLRLCSIMRRAAFVPGLADLAIRFFAASKFLRRNVTRATRGGRSESRAGGDCAVLGQDRRRTVGAIERGTRRISPFARY